MASQLRPPIAFAWGRRALSLGTLGYVAALALGTPAGHHPASYVVVLLAAALAWATSGSPDRAMGAAGWGLSVVIASEAGDGASLALQVSANVGALVSVAAGCISLSRVADETGIVPPKRISPRIAVGALVIAWSVASLTTLLPWASRPSWHAAHALAWVLAPMVASCAALFGSVERSARTRGFELGATQRAVAARELLWTILIATVVLAAAFSGRSATLGRLALGMAGTAVVAAATHPDAAEVGRASRRTTALAAMCGALLSAVTVARHVGLGAGQAVTLGIFLGVALGSVAVRLEESLRPGGGRWLAAFAKAAEGAGSPEPDHAIRECLMSLRAPLGLESPSPELWTFLPDVLTTVDAAGYLHERSARAPEAVSDLAARETFATLRTEVLAQVEVRRPDLRDVVEWMRSRDALAATAILREGEVDGLLVLPRGSRHAPLSLDEVRALRRVADRLAAPCRARAADARMRARVQDADARAQAAEERAAALARVTGATSGCTVSTTSRLASAASVGIYSAAARIAMTQLERRAASGEPIGLCVPSGVDPVPLLARAHLAGPRGRGPLVVVDGTSSTEHDVSRWTDPETSPLSMARKGLLAIVDAPALPREVQTFVVRACLDRQPPWEDADVQLAVTAAFERDAGAGDEAAQLRPGGPVFGVVEFPGLRDRPDDLRALVVDRLAREGMRLQGRPVGIEPAAYAKLANRNFIADEAELSLLVKRLVLSCEGEKISLGEVEALDVP